MQNVHPVAREFVLFCISRRGKNWPVIYDEMCRVAGNRLFRGLGYSELNGVGLSLGLNGIEETAKLIDSITA